MHSARRGGEVSVPFSGPNLGCPTSAEPAKNPLEVNGRFWEFRVRPVAARSRSLLAVLCCGSERRFDQKANPSDACARLGISRFFVSCAVFLLCAELAALTRLTRPGPSRPGAMPTNPPRVRRTGEFRGLTPFLIKRHGGSFKYVLFNSVACISAYGRSDFGAHQLTD